MIRHAEEKVKYQLPAMELQKSIKEEIENHCKNEKVPVAMLESGSRRPPLPKLRRAIALKLINEYGVSLAETARRVAGTGPVVLQHGDETRERPRRTAESIG